MHRPTFLRRSGRLAACVLAAGALAAPASHASIWHPVATGTDETITAIAYQSDSRLWIATANGIRKRSGSAFVQQLSAPNARFNRIEFNPSGTVGLAAADAGLWRYTAGAWTKQPGLLTYEEDGFNGTWCGPGPPANLPRTRPVTEDLVNVRWVDERTAFVFSERSGSIMRSDDAGVTWNEVNRRSDGTCRIDGIVTDGWVDPDDREQQIFLTVSGQVFLSRNGLDGNAVWRGASCGDRLGVDPRNPQDLYVGECWRSDAFAYSQDGGQSFSLPAIANGSSSHSVQFDVSGETTLAAGDAGYILTSIDHRTAYLQPGDGRSLTNDWRAVDLASPSRGAVGGIDGMLLLSDRLNTVPDIVAPTGDVQGPDELNIGDTATFTAHVTDEPGGSGIDPAHFAWDRDGAPLGSGGGVAVGFPIAGSYKIRVSFADRAGHAATAEKWVSVRPDEEPPTGRISGPEFTVAGAPATFTVQATDTGGSGLDPGGFSWSADDGRRHSGPSVTLTFPKTGAEQIEANFRDLAGNDGSAEIEVPVAPSPKDRQKPLVPPAPKPVVKRQGGGYVIPIKGGYNLPPNVSAKFGCRGEVLLNVKKSRRFLTARTTTLKKTCRYAKRLSVSKSKVGATKVLRLTVRFQGNAWLAPVKRTYNLKVPR